MNRLSYLTYTLLKLFLLVCCGYHFSNNCLTPTLNFKMPLKSSSLMFACHPSYHAETKGRVTLCNRIETTCLSTKVYCDVSVVFFLFITESDTNRENDETAGRHCMDLGLCSLKTWHMKGLQWPAYPCVYVYARVYVFVTSWLDCIRLLRGLLSKWEVAEEENGCEG